MMFDTNRGKTLRHADRNGSRMRREGRCNTALAPRPELVCPLPQALKVVLLTTAIMIALCVRSDAQQMLTAAEIREQIIGQDLRGRKGIMSVSLRYAGDGTVAMRSPLGTGTGRWTISDDRLCVRMETGPKQAAECLAITHQPDGTYRASNGLRLSPAE